MSVISRIESMMEDYSSAEKSWPTTLLEILRRSPQ